MHLVRRGGVVLIVAAALAANVAFAQQAPARDPAALAIIGEMAAFLRNLASFRVEAQVEYDALQADGQTIEFGATREIAVRRPNHIRATATDRSGETRSLYYDGKQVVVFDQVHEVYASAPETGDIDAMIERARDQLGVPIPLSELIASDFGEQLDEDLVFAAIVGRETLDGVACDHIALRNADRGIQIWVQQGATPVPRRITITWEKEPGRPQFRARFTKWELSPRLPDSLFTFSAPAGAERIVFHVPVAAEPATGGDR